MSRRPMILVLAVGLAVTACGASAVNTAPAAAGVVAPRVGTFLPRLVNATYRYSDCDIVHEARALGVDIQRVQQIADTSGLDSLVTTLARAGIASHLTIKANPGVSRALLPDDPALPGDENAGSGTTVTEYRRELGERLDEYQALLGSPAPMIAVENEANHSEYYDGSASDYLTELTVAVEAAHQRGVEVTDSGVASRATRMVAWNHIRITRGTDAADTFVRTVFRSSSSPNDLGIRDQLLGVSAADPDPYRHLTSAVLRANWRDAETMLSAYGTGPGQIPLDAVNFHWYAPDEPNTTSYTDAQALADTIDAFAAITGLPVVTNEIGQHGTDVDAVTETLQVIEQKGLPLVIWFDADGIPAHGLFEPTAPGQLRPTGLAFRDAVDPGAATAAEVGCSVGSQPDAEIATERAGPYAGGDVHSADPRGPQKQSLTAARLGTVKYFLRFGNDGVASEAFRLAATESGATGFEVHFLVGRDDVTDLVESGAFTTEPLAPGTMVELKVKVQATSGAAPGSRHKVDVTASSITDPSLLDVVRAKTTRG